jgi:hypothetical protein
VAVSERMDTTVAACQRPIRPRADAPGSVTVVPLFQPGIAVVVIPADFPKAGLVVIEQP